MSDSRLAAVSVALCLVLGFRPAPAGEKSTVPTPSAIKGAISRGSIWLKKSQREDGSWGPCVATGTYGGQRHEDGSACYSIGPTAFAVFVLSKCGYRKSDNHIHRALRWLDRNAPQRPVNDEFRGCSSYESAAVILMITGLNEPKPKPGKPAPWAKASTNPRLPPEGSEFAKADWTWMHWHIRNVLECQDRTGYFGYYANMRGYSDVSATQFALLALREAVRAGYPLEEAAPQVWERAARGLVALQMRNGAFPYHAGDHWTAGRTAAAVSSLLICREQMQLVRRGRLKWLKKPIDRGMESLAETFNVLANSSGDPRAGSMGAQYHYCHLYGIERVGALSGKRELGGKSWYARGAAFLLGEQGESGNWDDGSCMVPSDVLGTCFALLFLSRATPPAVTASSRR